MLRVDLLVLDLALMKRTGLDSLAVLFLRNFDVDFFCVFIALENCSLLFWKILTFLVDLENFLLIFSLNCLFFRSIAISLLFKKLSKSWIRVAPELLFLINSALLDNMRVI